MVVAAGERITCSGELSAQILVKPTMSLKKMVACANCSASTDSLSFSFSATDLGSIWYSKVSVRFFSFFKSFVLIYEKESDLIKTYIQQTNSKNCVSREGKEKALNYVNDQVHLKQGTI